MKKTTLLTLGTACALLLQGQAVFADTIQSTDTTAHANITAGELIIDPTDPTDPEEPGEGHWGPLNSIRFEKELDGHAHEGIKTINEENITTTILDGRGSGTWDLFVKLEEENAFSENHMTLKLDGKEIGTEDKKVASVLEWTPSKDVVLVPTLDFLATATIFNDSVTLHWNLTDGSVTES